MTPDPSRDYVVSISGGKDSTALWLHLKYELGLPKIFPVFADTGWEHELTYVYLDYLEATLGGLTRIRSPFDFIELAKKKKRFPSPRARFCTTELKMSPMKEWLAQARASGLITDPVMVVGVRAEESPSRAQMAEYVEVDEFYGIPQWRPIHKWTWEEVFACHDRHGVEANPLYKLGQGRVGCMPCIMANKKELKEIAKRFPETFDKVADAEAQVAAVSGRPSTFWQQGDVPKRFSSIAWTHPKTGEEFRLPTALDMRDYALVGRQPKTTTSLPTFTEPENQDLAVCSSIYGLCE